MITRKVVLKMIENFSNLAEFFHSASLYLHIFKLINEIHYQLIKNISLKLSCNIGFVASIY